VRADSFDRRGGKLTVAIEIRAEELPPAEYFRITRELLADDDGTGRLRLIWTSVPRCGARLVLAIPPHGYCWGMRFVRTAALTEWRLKTVEAGATLSAFLDMFSRLGLDPYRVPETLAERNYFVFMEDPRSPSYVPAPPDLPHAWFRSELLPDAARPFEDFLNRLRAHIAQLGKFFLLPRPDGPVDGDVSAWARSIDSNLERLFGSDHDADLWGYGGSSQRRIEALEEALRAVSAAHAETWLTPQFLEGGWACPRYPMSEAPPAYMGKGDKWFMRGAPARSPEEVYRDWKTLSLLRVKVLRKWRWPLGMKFLYERHDFRRVKERNLQDQPPWPALEAEVAAALKEARTAYPVLFEDLNLSEWALRQHGWW